MFQKRLCLLIILIGFYTAVMINCPSPWLKATGYRQGLELYARMVSPRSSYQFIHNPGLRKLETSRPVKIGAVTPEAGTDFASLLDQHLAAGKSCIVECSQLDTWHSSPAGTAYLQKMRPGAYRAVIFDGGHHLPSLGLAPDLIIIPAWRGYAVHSFMLDGIEIAQIQRLARECGSPSVIATVPRMALVKNEISMASITGKVLASCRFVVKNEFKPVAQPRMSKYNGFIFAYIDSHYARNPQLFIRRAEALGLKDVKQVYLAFDFKYSSRQQAGLYCAELEQALDRPVECVNHPVKAASLFWGGR
ncbi:hypothetical protein [Syntrophomonas curvata]